MHKRLIIQNYPEPLLRNILLKKWSIAPLKFYVPILVTSIEDQRDEGQSYITRILPIFLNSYSIRVQLHKICNIYVDNKTNIQFKF